MVELRRAAFLVLAVVIAGSTAVVAQDPARDLPWRRPIEEVDQAGCIRAGIARLAAGWPWEAARMFREATRLAEERPIGHLGLAIALRSTPNRAARLMWEAVKRVDSGTVGERAVVMAYQRYFGLTKQPEIVDAAFAEPPGLARSEALVRDLRSLTGPLAQQLAKVEQARLVSDQSNLLPDQARYRAQLHQAYLAQWNAMPFVVPGYEAVLARAQERDVPEAVARLPRHPVLGRDRMLIAKPLPGLLPRAGDRDTPLTWEPPRAPGFDLPRGLGGRGKFAAYAGKPVLVVFFLGFG